MGHYHAVNIRLKVKKAIPAKIMQFIEQAFYEADLEKAMVELEPASLTNEIKKTISVPILMSFYQKKYDLSNLGSMIMQQSHTHKSWGWRVKEDHGDFWLFESRASCNSRSVDEDLLEHLITLLLPYLVVESGDILVRKVYEDFPREQVLVVVNTINRLQWEDGYEYRSRYGDLNDGDHPYEQGRYYEGLLSEQEGANRLSRLATEEDEFTPPWFIGAVRERNAANKAEWDEENSAQWWG